MEVIEAREADINLRNSPNIGKECLSEVICTKSKEKEPSILEKNQRDLQVILKTYKGENKILDDLKENHNQMPLVSNSNDYQEVNVINGRNNGPWDDDNEDEFKSPSDTSDITIFSYSDDPQFKNNRRSKHNPKVENRYGHRLMGTKPYQNLYDQSIASYHQPIRSIYNRNLYQDNMTNHYANENEIDNIRHIKIEKHPNTLISTLNNSPASAKSTTSRAIDHFAEHPSLMQRCSSAATSVTNPLYKFWCSPSPLVIFRRRLRERRAKKYRRNIIKTHNCQHKQQQQPNSTNYQMTSRHHCNDIISNKNNSPIKMPVTSRLFMTLTAIKRTALGQDRLLSPYANYIRFNNNNHLVPVTMVTMAAFIRIADASLEPLADLTADVVDCFAVGMPSLDKDDAIMSSKQVGLGGDALVVLLANNVLRVYSKLEGNYIPTVEAFLPLSEDSVPTCFHYNSQTKTGVIGSSKGIIVIFEIDPGLNSLIKLINSERYFADNIKRIVYLPKSGVIIATSGYHLYIYDSNSLVVRNQMPSKSPVKSTYTCIEVSPDEDTLFLGTSSGTVEILDHNKGNCIFKNFLKGHDYEITAIHFVKDKSLLFTGDNYGFIQMWYLQAGQHMVNLFHHQAAILALNTYIYDDKFYLASICKQNLLVHWDLNKERHSPVVWNKSQECETCTKPFFFNIRKLWNLKQIIGERRHHCRSCGKSICSNCCAKMERLPHFGLELQSNSCYDCRSNYTDAELQTSIIAIQGEDSKIRRAHFSRYFSAEEKREINSFCIVVGSFYQSIKLKNLYHEF